MAEEKDNEQVEKKDAADSGFDDAPTVKLAAKATAPTYAEPDQPDVEIHIGEEAIVFVPSLDQQQAGFKPYSKVGEKRVDATAVLLTQYPGIYKKIADK